MLPRATPVGCHNNDGDGRAGLRAHAAAGACGPARGGRRGAGNAGGVIVRVRASTGAPALARAGGIAADGDGEHAAGHGAIASVPASVPACYVGELGELRL